MPEDREYLRRCELWEDCRRHFLHLDESQPAKTHTHKMHGISQQDTSILTIRSVLQDQEPGPRKQRHPIGSRTWSKKSRRYTKLNE